MRIMSSAFVHNSEIPIQYTCDGADLSPPLEWSELPRGTKALALIVDDPDAPDPQAPRTTFVHWVLYNIPPSANGLKKGIADEELPAGTRMGLNGWNKPSFGGPCPPIGKHRYFHKLYALDIPLPDLAFPDKASLKKAMEGHILAEAELVGTYERPG